MDTRRVPTGAALLLIGATLWAVAPALGARAAVDPAPFNGTWMLNLDASTNPSGPGGPRGGGGRTGTPGAGGGSSQGGSGSGGSGYSQFGGQDKPGAGSSAAATAGGGNGGVLGAAELARFNAMMKIMTKAPQTLLIAATAKDVTLTADGGQPAHFNCDDKKIDVPTNAQFGNLEVKTKWDNNTLHRESKTVDGLTVVEDYTVSADGKQLTEKVELKSQVQHLTDAQRQPIIRVYDRAAGSH